MQSAKEACASTSLAAAMTLSQVSIQGCVPVLCDAESYPTNPQADTVRESLNQRADRLMLEAEAAAEEDGEGGGQGRGQGRSEGGGGG